MLYTITPLGRMPIPSWQEKEVEGLTDEQLLERAVAENKLICVSPAVYAMVEKRFLGRELQRRINPNVGVRHATLELINKLDDGQQPDHREFQR